jgi:hypothetical protein
MLNFNKKKKKKKKKKKQKKKKKKQNKKTKKKQLVMKITLISNLPLIDRCTFWFMKVVSGLIIGKHELRLHV